MIRGDVQICASHLPGGRLRSFLVSNLLCLLPRPDTCCELFPCRVVNAVSRQNLVLPHFVRPRTIPCDAPQRPIKIPSPLQSSCRRFCVTTRNRICRTHVAAPSCGACLRYGLRHTGLTKKQGPLCSFLGVPMMRVIRLSCFEGHTGTSCFSNIQKLKQVMVPVFSGLEFGIWGHVLQNYPWRQI